MGRSPEINFLRRSDRQKIVFVSVPFLISLLVLASFFGVGGRAIFDFLQPSSTYAAAVSWDGGGDGTTWEDPDNWSDDAVPDDTDDVTIDVNVTVDLNGSTTINSLTLGNAGGTTSPVLNFDYDALTGGALILDDAALTIYSGATVTHTAGDAGVNGTIYIDVQTGVATIDGNVNADELGYEEDAGPDPGTLANFIAGGAGHGGQGADGDGRDIVVGQGGGIDGSITAPVELGSGGGSDPAGVGGHGGGAIRIDVAGALDIDGSISADAETAVSGNRDPGGGAGGSVYITTGGALTGTGTISADGGGGAGRGGGGGGGRIAIYYNSDTSSITYSAAGGTSAGCSWCFGGAGTIYFSDTGAGTDELRIDNDNTDVVTGDLDDRFYGKTPLTDSGPAAFTYDTLTLQNDGHIDLNSNTTLTVTTLNWSAGGILSDNGGTFDPISNSANSLTVPGTAQLYMNTSRSYTAVTVESGATITGSNNNLTGDGKMHEIDLTVNGNLTVDGTISLNERGYYADNGPNPGTLDSALAGGAGHGGEGGGANGGDAPAGLGGGIDGSITAPVTIGSGGGSDPAGIGGRGGGAIRIDVTGDADIDGTISANGGADVVFNRDPGGGAGGSVYLTIAGTLTGTGTVSANGGDGAVNGGGGGGGRVAIYFDTNSSTISTVAYGGEGVSCTYCYGGAGTVYLNNTNASTDELIIDNGNIDLDADDLDDRFIGRSVLTDSGPAVFTYDTVTIQNDGNLDLNSDTTLNFTTLNWTGGIVTDNGGTMSPFSDGAGLVIPAGSQFYANTSRTYTSLTVSSGATITGSNNSTTASGKVYEVDLTINGNAAVDGEINLDQRGYYADHGPNPGTLVSAVGGGAGHGGEGANGRLSATNLQAGQGGGIDGSITAPVTIGSGGASDPAGLGGRGGGALRLTVNGDLDVDGVISADGGGDVIFNRDPGGGAGGSLYITVTGTLTGTGSLTAAGGEGRVQGGGGGGGRIAVHYDEDASTISLLANGGTSAACANCIGGAGTVYKNDTTGAGTDELIIDNNNIDVTNLDDRFAGQTVLTDSGPATFTFDTVTIQSDGNLDLNSDTTLNYTALNWAGGIITDNGGTMNVISGAGSLTVPTGARLVANTVRSYTDVTLNGSLAHSANELVENEFTIDLTTTGGGDFTINATGSVDVTGAGHVGDGGQGAGNDGGTYGTGAGHGGVGGVSVDIGSTGGITYDSETMPAIIGSGGGNDVGSQHGGSGGGAVKLTVAGDLILNGPIRADAADNATNDGGGGSGGAVWLVVTDAVTGGAAISADGGDGEHANSGSGGGGRVRVECGDGMAWTENVSVEGSTFGNSGSDGTFSDACSGSVPSSPGGSDVTVVTDHAIEIADSLACIPDRVVTLRLSAQNAKAVIVSEDPNFLDANWESFTENAAEGTMERTFVLSEGDGQKTVYARFRSSSLNLSSNASDTIMLDQGMQCEMMPDEPVVSDDIDPSFVVGCDGLPVPPLTLEEQERFKLGISPTTGQAASVDDVRIGSYIRSESQSTVYCVDRNFILRPFLDEVTYFTHQRTFQGTVLWVTDDSISLLAIGEPMLPNPEVVLVKFTSGPEVYLLEVNEEDPETGILKWIVNEETAMDVVGVDWADYVIDLVPELEESFTFGESIDSSVVESIGRSDLRRRLLLNEKNKDQPNDSQLVVNFLSRIMKVFSRNVR